MLKGGGRCPVCGEGVLKSNRIREEFEYKGHRIGLDVTVYSCSICGEEFYDDEEMKSYQKTIKDFQRSVDGLLTSDDIKQVREKFGLSQRKLARILGVAERSIAKYELGIVAQSKAMDNLLRALKEFPELLRFLMEINTGRKRKIRRTLVTKDSSTAYNIYMHYPYKTGYEWIKEGIHVV